MVKLKKIMKLKLYKKRKIKYFKQDLLIDLNFIFNIKDKEYSLKI